MNRLGFLVLSILARNNALDRISAMTVKEITATEDLGYRDNTIFKKIILFEEMGYVAAGYKEGRARTFYITDKGIEFLKKA